ncbi:unnamed protein product [Prunus armeniaca]
MLGPPPKVPNDDHRKEDNSPSFRNAQELKAAGVHFRRKVFVLDLIDYEMCPDFPNNFGVISYFRFLSSLIAHPDDAKQLRSARVLCNLRGRDQSLADLFNEIGPDMVLAHTMYNSINAKVEKHYTTKWKAWFAQFFEDHFSSPWVMLAFICTQPSVFIRNRVPYLHFQS